MIPMEPGPEDYARHIAEQRKRMQEAQAIATSRIRALES